MGETSFVIEHRETKERPVSVELRRGVKGVYGWTIKAYADHYSNAIAEIRLADGRLRELFGQLELEE